MQTILEAPARCQMCKGQARNCVFCRETGEQPTTADLKMGGPFIAYRLIDGRPYVVHAGGRP